MFVKESGENMCEMRSLRKLLLIGICVLILHFY